MDPLYQRTSILFEPKKFEKIKNTHVVIAGLGGVGSFVAESLSRAGVGKLTLIDHDQISASNLNRQLVALNSTIGKFKVDVAKERILDINPNCDVIADRSFLGQETIGPILDKYNPDYLVDAIDSLNPKVRLLALAHQKGIKVVSSMGSGGKLDPTKIKITDLMKTDVCPLARQVRKKIKKWGIGKGITVVYSTEIPKEPLPPEAVSFGRDRAVNGTISYMPAAFALFLSSVVINGINNN